MSKNLDTKLKSHKIRPTQNRRAILDAFSETLFALSHADLEKQLSDTCDRVTIYRTLETFESNGLIHRIMDDSQIAKYALCKEDDCNSQSHNDQHLHFRCINCHKIYCLAVVKIPEVQLPKKYKLQSLSMTAEGFCDQCSEL